VKGTIVAVLVFGACCAAAGQLLFKVGANGGSSLRSFINAPLAFGLVLYGMGTVAWIYALSREQLISVYPFTVLTFALVYAAAVIVFGERPTPSGVMGVGLILGGLYLITR
jgi:drug/metabolite transporter (DMT)-like permease